MRENGFYHFGVKGMKWGRRKPRSKARRVVRGMALLGTGAAVSLAVANPHSRRMLGLAGKTLKTSKRIADSTGMTPKNAYRLGKFGAKGTVKAAKVGVKTAVEKRSTLGSLGQATIPNPLTSHGHRSREQGVSDLADQLNRARRLAAAYENRRTVVNTTDAAINASRRLAEYARNNRRYG